MPVWLLAVLGCGGECGPEECAAVCNPEGVVAPVPGEPTEPPVPGEPAPTAAPTGPISPFEQQVLDAVLTEIRNGVRPSGEEAIGVCRGKKDCDKFYGPDAGKLGKGNYWVRALLAVPPGPAGTWKVHFSTECKSPAGESRMFERDYDLVYSGPDQATKLNLRAFASPSEEGPEVCTWTLVTPHPTGDKVFTGGWEVPGK